VPQGVLLAHIEYDPSILSIEKLFGGAVNYPLIVKPHDDGCSVLVQKACKREQLITSLDKIFATGRQHALIEECVQGMELTVGVIGNDTPQALPPSEAIAQGGILSIEEKFLPGAGENQTPARLPQEALTFVQRKIEQVYSALQCKGYARIDCFYQTAQQSMTGKERVVILEINSLPGMTPATCIFHQAAELGIKPMDFVDKIIELGFEEHGRRQTMRMQQPMSIETKSKVVQP
jgi:D-alanine--D-alanine ligase